MLRYAASLAFACRSQLLCRARYVSQEIPAASILASRPESMRKFIEREKSTLIQAKTSPNVKYMDFRHRFSTNHWRSHLIIIRRQKMKKHRRRKWRKKFKCLLAKKRFKREISKEKAFRVELLTMIKRAEQFDPKEYALNKIKEINNKPRKLTKEESIEELKELIRKHRYQVTYIKPKHKRPETYGLSL